MGILLYDLITFLIFYQIALFGVSVSMHRYFSHKAFQTSRGFEIFLFIIGSSVLQYSPLYWASFHRKHHRFPDRPGDPHSPWSTDTDRKMTLRTWAHSHFLWGFSFDFETTARQYAPDWLAKPHLQVLHKYHYFIGLFFIVLAGLFEMFLMGTPEGFFRGLYFGGILRILTLHNFVFF